ncbi:hypothetical protein GUJ93_ZPchr0010g8033 [Zizania palustris]|uniref:Zinc finger PHD-type domain-containing protein n=1 Tax=Zizania palustris TaxID=103762 RepID=A0A8J5W7F3_ZIZPA|nr:hypothetical protein GUJ93_ZPchr0010g8033 [Zizania palustris]
MKAGLELAVAALALLRLRLRLVLVGEGNGEAVAVLALRKKWKIPPPLVTASAIRNPDRPHSLSSPRSRTTAMTPPFRPSSPAGPAPRGCGGYSCTSGSDAWPLHHVRHDGVFCRLCSSCVMLYHPTAFCSACLLLLPLTSPSNSAPEACVDPVLSPPGPITACSRCGIFVAHHSCVPDSASNFVCHPCAAAADGNPFSFTPAGVGLRTMDEHDARVLLVAARLAHESVRRAADAAREEAGRCVREAAAARKRSREMLDVAFRAMQVEAREAKKPVVAPPSKKKTPKSSEANRDKLLKLNATQQPALAFAAAAAAAANSMPLSMPSYMEDKKLVKQEAQGSVDRSLKDDRTPLFGTLQS